MTLHPFRIAVPVALLAAIAFLAWHLHAQQGGRDLSFSLLAGAAFGIVGERKLFSHSMPDIIPPAAAAVASAIDERGAVTDLL